MSQKFVQKVQAMTALKSNSNPPSPPFFKGGIFLRGDSNPSLKKKSKGGEGEIFGRNDVGII